MAHRALWKGWLRIAALSCPVALHSAVSASDHVTFATINRATGNRARRAFVDEETGEAVERDDQVKGYEVAPGEFLQFESEEVAAVVPQGDKTLSVGAFVPCEQIDTLYLDTPYLLAPDGPGAEEVFALIRDGLRAERAAAVATAVLFRRARNVLIRAEGDGLLAVLLAFDYEVREAADAFSEIPDLDIPDEMMDLVEHIIAGKAGDFDPAEVSDRYESAVAELVQAKLAGRPLPKRAPKRAEKVVDLMTALRASAGKAETKQKPKRPARRPARKAG